MLFYIINCQIDSNSYRAEVLIIQSIPEVHVNYDVTIAVNENIAEY
jgi:hypothetical protein